MPRGLHANLLFHGEGQDYAAGLTHTNQSKLITPPTALYIHALHAALNIEPDIDLPPPRCPSICEYGLWCYEMPAYHHPFGRPRVLLCNPVREHDVTSAGLLDVKVSFMGAHNYFACQRSRRMKCALVSQAIEVLGSSWNPRGRWPFTPILARGLAREMRQDRAPRLQHVFST